ncbi:MAG TPA: CPBP family intramembrane glutamic endopeptidase [Thermoanaerobaculia bacterium]|nr:CPBP family intramembrane glutamic endopeptidase [Thermoanaerobaculia bacterium]
MTTNTLVFLLLLLAGCAGIALSFARARSRAVFAEDGFHEPGRRTIAVALLASVLLLTVAIPFAGGFAGAQPETENLTVVSLFAVHAILLFFLACYYALSARHSLADFLKIRSPRPVADLSAGVMVGAAGWLLTVLAALGAVGIWYLVKRSTPGTEENAAVSPTILWIVSQPVWVKVAIVVSAMVVEELFFRSFLQTRVGPLAATLMFTAAHGAYGQPLVLIGILVISAVLSVTFALYGNVLPCIVAHGIFDSIQMFVLIPLVTRAAQAG